MGSHLVDHLMNDGYEVVVLDNLTRGKRDYVNPKAQLVFGDLRDVNSCVNAVEGVDCIFHLGAHAAEGQSVFAPKFTFDVNVGGFLNLFVEAINQEVQTFVFTSSMAVFGNQPQLPMREDQPRQPEDPYGITKASIERLLEVYSRVYDFNYVIIRPHNVYGPRQSLSNPYRNVIGIWMNRIMLNKPPIIYGDGEQTRAFTYIDDCTPYLAKSAFTEEAYGEIINIGSEEVVTINEACRVVLEKMGSNLKPLYRPARPLEVKHAYCSSEKAKRILGYCTNTRFERGIEKMAEWAKTRGPEPFNYAVEKFEIVKKVPDVWRLKEL